MKIKEIRDMSDAELTSEIGRLRRQLYDFRSQAVTEKLEASNLLGRTKRDIARCLTVQKERLLAVRAGGEA